jgi:hypothetical protein
MRRTYSEASHLRLRSEGGRDSASAIVELEEENERLEAENRRLKNLILQQATEARLAEPDGASQGGLAGSQGAPSVTTGAAPRAVSGRSSATGRGGSLAGSTGGRSSGRASSGRAGGTQPRSGPASLKSLAALSIASRVNHPRAM